MAGMSKDPAQSQSRRPCLEGSLYLGLVTVLAIAAQFGCAYSSSGL